MKPYTRLSDFLQEHLSSNDDQQALNAVLGDIADAAVQIATTIDHGAIDGNMGNLEAENVQGEVQKALDVITNDQFIEACQRSGHVSGMASEEIQEIIPVENVNKEGPHFLLLFDPLDGSSNVNVNISVGTIFSVLPTQETTPSTGDFLQPGDNQVCAGYVLYGTSTMLVFSTGDGVNGFTLDSKTGEFYLTHPDMRVPEAANEFAVNMSNYRFWQPPMQQYVDECLQGKEGPREKDFNMRWVASMVAEVHRIMVRGGVFMYPVDSKIKAQGGKLRLMYEANPMSMLIEQAGGGASNGLKRIMAVAPKSIHQRVSVMMGAKEEVDLLTKYHKKG